MSGFIKRIIQGFAGIFMLGLWAIPLQTQAVQIVPQHNLDCSAAFPCPKALHRRVDFWVEVFSEWDKNTVIFHDADAPWRVYQTINGVKSCGEKKVKRARKRLKANLNALGKRLKKDQAPKGRTQKKLAEQFDRLNSKIVFKSAKNTRCQQGVKDQFTNALGRFEQYAPIVKRIIAETNMPEDLLYLPFVESSYRANAYSKVGAAGMWQIMPNTARDLGMELNAVLDERLDPEAATRGAMRYFKNAQKKLIPVAKAAKPNISEAEINPFIVTSYNYGINGMRRAIKQIGPDFMKVLDEYKSASFQVAVKNFYASFLAARHLARNQSDYFGAVAADTGQKYQTFILPSATSVERIKYQFGLKEAELKKLNPALTKFAWNNWRLIPSGYRLHLPYRKHLWTDQIDALSALRPEPQPVNKTVYRVRRGDTACGIANAFKVSCKALISVNRLGKKAVVRIGQKLDVPGRGATQTASTTTRKTKSSVYKVKRGDTACKVAKRVGVSCRELIRLNKLGRKATIKIGQRLRVPGGNTVLASATPKAVSLRYNVKSGDTACQIASRYSVPCAKLIADNNLNKKGTIRIGQKLTIQGRSRKASKNVSVSQYTVRSGDTACEIAERFDVPCKSLMRSNRLSKRGGIKVGQVLKITSTVGPETIIEQSSGEQLAWLKIIDTLPNMRLKASQGGQRLKVLPNETVAHYSDWMGGRWASKIRNLNGLHKGAALVLGKSVKVPITLAKTKAKFKARRSEFHQVLAEQFKERFKVNGLSAVKVKSGQSLWLIANQNEVPLWLLMRFNPKVSGHLNAGQVLNVPDVVAR
ncbi:MAG: LysM peptidoglycan-binding domain-containing protein [Arenicellales bacterium]